MGVIMQTFYWDCPNDIAQPFGWWKFIESKLNTLHAAGFTALWLPPISKAANQQSMGYDPFDYYDLGEVNQKGGVPTWYGKKADLLSMINKAHSYNLSVYADLVLNHNSGGELEVFSPKPI